MTRLPPRAAVWLWAGAIALVVAGLLVWILRSGVRGGSDLLAEGEQAYSSGDWSGAADAARRRLRASPHDEPALRLLARATARLGRDVTANRLFARLGSDAFEAEDYYLLGNGLEKAGQIQEAERVWQKALALEPDHAGSLDRLVSLYTARNRLIEAAGLAERLSGRPGMEMKADLSLAVIRAELGDPVSAAAILRRAIGRPEASSWDNTTAAHYHKLLSRTLLQTEQAAEARQVLERILALGPIPRRRGF